MNSLCERIILAACAALYLLTVVQALTPMEGDIFENYQSDVGARYYANKFDIIVVGLGPAGSVLAARLSENSNLKVLALEAGGTDNYLEVRAPPLFTSLYDPVQPTFLDTSYGYINEQKEFLQRGRKMMLPRIKMFGGCGSGNTMAMFRGDKRDYAAWKASGLPIDFDTMLPYFKKTEKCLFERSNVFTTHLHNFTGEWPVGPQSYTHDITKEYTNAMSRALRLPIQEDFNNGHPLGAGYAPVKIVNGFRVTVSNALINEETLQRQNLLVKLNSQVTRILFKGKTAIGVEYKDLTTGKLYTAYAEREVILSGGAYNSPQLLMLSGIGDKKELKKMNIPVVSDVPGVGKNLQDHVLVGVSVNVTGIKTFESIFDSDEALLAAFDELFTQGSGPLSSNVGEGYCPANTGVDNKNYPSDQADVIYEMGALLYALDGLMAIPGVHAVSAGPDLMAITSKGTVSLRSKNPFDSPIINHNYLSDPKEVDRLISGLQTLRQVFKNMLGSRYVNEILPGENVKTRAQFLEYLYQYAMSGYHPCCSARMGPAKDKMAVVDSDYKVRGVDNLRVVDASSLPTLTTSNIEWPIIAMAERAADLITDRCGGDRKHGKGNNDNIKKIREFKLRSKMAQDRRERYGDAYKYLKQKHCKN